MMAPIPTSLSFGSDFKVAQRDDGASGVVGGCGVAGGGSGVSYGSKGAALSIAGLLLLYRRRGGVGGSS